MKHAFANRAEHMADSTFVDVPIDELLDSEYLDALAETNRLDQMQQITSYGSVTPSQMMMAQATYVLLIVMG